MVWNSGNRNGDDGLYPGMVGTGRMGISAFLTFIHDVVRWNLTE